MHEVEPRPRGLTAIHDARQRRGRFEAIPTRFWPWLLGIIAAWGMVYWYVTDTRLDRWRDDLLTRQRAAAAETAPRYDALRSRVEAWVQEAGGTWQGDRVTQDARASSFRQRPGIYLRLHIDDAHSVSTIRTAAVASLRDGFTTCLGRGDNPNPFTGQSCKANRECGTGQHCNQEQHCSAPAQPFNLRSAYRGARVLSGDWSHEVAIAGDDMRLRYLERDFDNSVRDDLPLAVEMLRRAEFFILVLDEPSASPVEVPAGKTRSEALQAVAHPARVFVYDLASNKQLLRVRDEVTADVGVATADPEIAAAVRRQANNCALALSVAEKLGEAVASSK